RAHTHAHTLMKYSSPRPFRQNTDTFVFHYEPAIIGDMVSQDEKTHTHTHTHTRTHAHTHTHTDVTLRRSSHWQRHIKSDDTGVSSSRLRTYTHTHTHPHTHTHTEHTITRYPVQNLFRHV